MHNEGLLCSEVVGGMAPSLRSAHLQEIWGVGPWTCDMVAIFFYGDPDVWPEGMSPFRRRCKGLLGTRRSWLRIDAPRTVRPLRFTCGESWTERENRTGMIKH